MIPSSANVNGNEIGLFDDAAIYKKERRKEATFILGKIIRIRNCTKSIVEYAEPEPKV